MTLKVGGLFAGYGGLDMAIESVLDAELAWYAEYDNAPSKIMAHHWPDLTNLGDVTKVDWAAVPNIDVLTGGYPCQPFSLSGKREGTNDDRHLWPFVLQAIRHLRPRLVVLENVAGHRSLGFGDVLGDLARERYDARWYSVRASDVGAPHPRPRLFIFATPAHTRGVRGGQALQHHGGGPQKVNRAGIPDERDRHALPAGPFREWGKYAPAIRRWELVLGRTAPHPVAPGPSGRPMLSPAFCEWLMGLPAGHVTDPAIGISRNEQLKALGNGVVPAQAASATRAFLSDTQAERGAAA